LSSWTEGVCTPHTTMSTNQTTWTPLCVEGAFMGTDARFGDHRGYFY